MMTSMSYFHKPRSNPLDNRTLHQILDDNSTKHPDKESIVFYDENQNRFSMTFKQLKDQSIKFAASLLQLGFKRGDRILLYAPNSLEFVVSWMAMNRLGVCAVLMCPGDVEWQEVYLLKKLKCSGLICGLESLPDELRKRIVDEITEIVQEKNEEGSSFTKVVITIGKTDASIDHPHIVQYENLVNNDVNLAEVIIAANKVDAEDSAFVCFTSGSTGEAKAVVFTHHAIVNAVNLVLPGMGIDGDRKSFSGWPISWGCGAPVVVISLVIGFTYITTVFTKLTIRDSFKVMFDIITAENCTSCSIPQEHVHQLLQERFQEKHNFSKISIWGFGSQIVPRKTIKSLLDAFPQSKALLVYAMTEVLTIGMQPLSLRNIDNKDDYGKLYMFPDIEVKVIDQEGQVVPLGSKGEICVRGPKMFLEYMEDSSGTSMTKTSTSWVHTSDYGIMYDRARIKVLGRKTDLIFTRDQAIFPVEVEEVVLDNPDIQDVVAVGVPNGEGSENICLCIIQAPGSNLEVRMDELEKWCHEAFGASIINNVIPKPSHFLLMKSFPISDAEKIDRLQIKEYAVENCKI